MENRLIHTADLDLFHTSLIPFPTKMADTAPAKGKSLTKRQLKYNLIIKKLPEICKVDLDDVEEITCMKTNLLKYVNEEFFVIIGELYHVPNLRSKVLEHIKTNWKYYRVIASKYLSSKKLELAIWLVDMLHFDIPADELCLHACGQFLNIHITVDYHFGHWSTLDITGISHELLAKLSDVHLIYMGEGRYSLLTKPSLDVHSPRSTITALQNTELKTTNNLQSQTDFNTSGIFSDSTESYDLNTTGIYSDSTESYDLNEMNTSNETILYNSATELHLKTDYSITVPTKSRVKTKKTEMKAKNHKTKHKISNTTRVSRKRKGHLFRCPVSQCKIRKPTRKDITAHYKLKHNIFNLCTVCKKVYTTPYSLQQHQYYHQKRMLNFTCVRCRISFPFLSQLRIHRLKHLRKQRHECTECFSLFKYRHDMLKHRREHTAAILRCKQCDYTGSKLKLAAHSKQHDPATYKRCTLCNMVFIHRMSYWRHNQICQPKLSSSPIY